jgi:hypothetical protein
VARGASLSITSSPFTKEIAMESQNASPNKKMKKPESAKTDKPLAKGQQKTDSNEEEKAVDSQSEFSRIDKLRNKE